MGLLKLQVAQCPDTVLARDRVVNTLYFDVGFDILSPFSSDINELCSDLADLYISTWNSATYETRVTAYDPSGPPPHYPIGESLKNVGATFASDKPREVAICLSFYAQRNIPRQRGRIYLPMCTHGSGVSSLRPSSGLRDTVISMAQGFADLGGTNVDWQVYSGRDHAARKVTHAWVDDEWDTQRRRGLRPTTRTMWTTDE